LGDAAETVAGRRGADEGRWFGGEPSHSRLVAEDRTARARRSWIDGKHGHLVTLGHEIETELIDQSGLAGAGYATNADADRLAGIRQEGFDQGLRRALIFGLGALDKGDGSGQRHAIAGAYGVGHSRLSLRCFAFAHGLAG